MGVGQPVVQGGKAHLGTVAHQKENEGRLEPGHGRIAGRDAVCELLKDGELIRGFVGAFQPVAGKGQREQEVADQGQSNAHGADDQIFPCGFERFPMPVEIDQRRGSQRGRLDTDPERAEMARAGDKRHGREKDAQAGREAAFRRVGKAFAGLHVGAFAEPFLRLEVADGIDGGHEEEGRGNAEEKTAQHIGGEQAAEGRRRVSFDDAAQHGGGQHGVQDGGGHKQRAARGGSGNDHHQRRRQQRQNQQGF